MKKYGFIFYLLVLMFVVSCKKDNLVPSFIITQTQFSNDWETVEYIYGNDSLLNDSIHTMGCLAASKNNITIGKGMIFIKINRIDTISKICLLSDCSSGNYYKYELSNNKINFTLANTSTVDLSFDILSFDGNNFILKLSSSVYKTHLIGGVYVLRKPLTRIVSPFLGNWINEYVLVNDKKDTTAERYQFYFKDNGNVVLTSANDKNINFTYDSWVLFTDAIEFIKDDKVDKYKIFQEPYNNKMILSVYNYKYYLLKVK